MRLLLGVGCAALLAACTTILGNDFEIADGPGQGGSTSSTTTTGQAGNASGANGGAGVGGSVGGSGGAGGSGGPCDMYAVGACGPNKKCSILNLTTGDTGCIATTSRPAWSACANDGECADGTYCSALYGVCKPLCTTNADCPGTCDDAWIEYTGATIPGIKLCASDCDPITQLPCQNPGASCILYLGWDCVRAGSIIHGGGPCSGQENQDFTADCEAGTYCWGNPSQPASFHCEAWCPVPGGQSTCPSGSTCYDVGIQHQGNVVGHCAI